MPARMPPWYGAKLGHFTAEAHSFIADKLYLSGLEENTAKHPFKVSLGSSGFEHQTEENLNWW
jgi:hypothetical protein